MLMHQPEGVACPEPSLLQSVTAKALLTTICSAMHHDECDCRAYRHGYPRLGLLQSNFHMSLHHYPARCLTPPTEDQPRESNEMMHLILNNCPPVVSMEECQINSSHCSCIMRLLRAGGSSTDPVGFPTRLVKLAYSSVVCF